MARSRLFEREHRCCCCGAKRGTTLAGTLTLVTSTLQLAGQLAAYGVLDLWDILKNDAKVERNGDKMTAVYHQVPRAYMVLAGCDLLMIFISLLMLLGNSKGYKALLQAWFVYLIAYIIYETTVNVLFFVNVFRGLSEQMHPDCGDKCGWIEDFGMALTIPLLCYWLVKLLLNASGLYIVWHRIREIKLDRYFDLPFETDWERTDYV